MFSNKRLERELEERDPKYWMLAKHLDRIEERQDALLDYLGLSIEKEPEKLVVRKRGESEGE